jgi:hypothetical protein
MGDLHEALFATSTNSIFVATRFLKGESSDNHGWKTKLFAGNLECPEMLAALLVRAFRVSKGPIERDGDNVSESDARWIPTGGGVEATVEEVDVAVGYASSSTMHHVRANVKLTSGSPAGAS